MKLNGDIPLDEEHVTLVAQRIRDIATFRNSLKKTYDLGSAITHLVTHGVIRNATFSYLKSLPQDDSFIFGESRLKRIQLLAKDPKTGIRPLFKLAPEQLELRTLTNYLEPYPYVIRYKTYISFDLTKLLNKSVFT